MHYNTKPLGHFPNYPFLLPTNRLCALIHPVVITALTLVAPTLTGILSSSLIEVVLGHDTDLVTFLQAASSASELRNLTILSVITSRSILDTNTCSPITFPNLRSLFLGGLCYNTLETLLRTIDSCTHRMSLVLGRRSLMIRDGDIEIRAIVSNSLHAYRFLEYIPVDILTIFGHEWFHYHIHGLLEILPALKTLNIDICTLDQKTRSRLGRPPNAEDGSFAALETLRITGSRMEIGTIDKLKKVIASHPLGQVVLGTTVTHVDSTGAHLKTPL
ncbi:hypothetical protein ACGC1H_003506 [Rhizoctonia solani]